ncbi:MAG: metal-dependent hydrolase [Halodesulfurarchaeum sp.]
MLRSGHQGLALLLYTPLSGLIVGTGGTAMLVGVPVLLLAARVPDFDRWLPLLSHRGLTHTIWFAIVLSVAFAVGIGTVLDPAITPESHTLLVYGTLGAVVGLLSHLLGDSVTPQGIRPFWPLSSRRIALHIVRSSDRRVNAFLLVLGVGALVWVFIGS